MTMFMTLVKFDLKMDLIKKIRHSTNLSGVTVNVDNEVLVCEKDKNYITVYSTDLYPADGIS